MTPFAYLIISLILTSIMLSVIFLMAWQTFGRKPYAMAWCVAYFSAAAQWSLNAFGSSIFEDRRVYWMVASAVAVVVVSLAFIGFRMWAGLKPFSKRLAAAGLILLAAIFWHTVVDRHVGWSMALGPAFAAIICIWCSVIIFRRNSRTAPAEYGAAIAFFAFGVAQLIAGAAAFLQGPEINDEYLNIYSEVNFLTLPTAYIGMGLFTVFILASDLSVQMKALARTDQLTGLLNRRGFDRLSEPLLAHARRNDEPLSLILCDVDWFKKINDAHGHWAGDQVLVQLANFLTTSSADGFHVARLGGEEFVVVAPNVGQDEAMQIAERMRSELQRLPIFRDDASVRITASFGIAELQPADRDLYDIFRRADIALYQAKEAGRNLVRSSGLTQ